MRNLIALTLLLSLLLTSGAQAASYWRTDGVKIWTIQSTHGGDLDYTGPNLEPYADLRGVDLDFADLFMADLRGANLSGADVTWANLKDADLRGALLNGVYNRRMYLTGTDFSGADLSGADLSGEWPCVNNEILKPPCPAYLGNADLTGANLSGANLGNTYLSGATLDGVRSGDIIGEPLNLPNSFTLVGGYLIGPEADLGDANLTDANLTDANLTEADLSDANLTGADLSNAYLSDANLTGADLSYAIYLGTTFGSPYYSAETAFTNAFSGGSGSAQFDPVAAGWILVPEPHGMLLGLTALLTLAGLRRCNTPRQ